MKHIFLIITFIFSVNVYAEKSAEVWQCQESEYGNWSNILVNATVNADRSSGKIFVAGVVHESSFKVNGFNRRWNFGLDEDNTYDYAFIIEPNGAATYYDFGKKKSTKPSMVLHCRLTK